MSEFGVAVMVEMFVPFCAGFMSMLIVIGVIETCPDIIATILTRRISVKIERAKAWRLVKQTASARLGVTMRAGAHRRSNNMHPS